MLSLKNKYKEQLKILPNRFTVRDAEVVGIPRNDLTRLRYRGVIERRQVGKNMFVWVKR